MAEGKEKAAKKAKKEYLDAEPVAKMAKKLIPQYHPELATARIDYVFISEASMKNGRPVRGKVRKLSGYVEHRIENDFAIEIALDLWNSADAHSRMALVDHLLERCTGEEDEEDAGAPMKWKLRTPDVEEFTSILKRYGAWNDDLKSFVGVESKGIDVDAMARDAIGQA
jgi:hypothetical protein